MNLTTRLTLGSGDRGKVKVVGRFGTGSTVPPAESTDGVPRDGYELGAMALQGAGGMEIGLSRRLAAFVEYKFTRSRQTIAIDRDEAKESFTSHHAVFGIAWRFH